MASNDITVSNIQQVRHQTDAKVNQKNTLTEIPVEEKVQANGINPVTRGSQEVSQFSEQKEKQENLQLLNDTVSQINDHMQSINRNLQFSVDEDSEQQSGSAIIVKVIDADTDEVVRQIPSEEVLNVRHAIAELRGLLLETKA